MNDEPESAITTKDRFAALASLFWAFGLLVFSMGGVSYWSAGDNAETPNFHELQVYTGELQRLSYRGQSAKAPSLIDIVIYNEQDHLKRGFIRHAKRAWEERIRPFNKQQLTIYIDGNKHAWRVEAGDKVLISESEIARNFSHVSKHEISLGKAMMFIGAIMILVWLFALRKRFPMSEQ